jgi:hypothetical protein
MAILDMTNLVEFVNNINKRLNGLVNRVTKRAVRVNKNNNKPNNVNPSKKECIDEFKNGDQLKNTLQALKIANDPKERDKLLKAKACLAYKNNMKNTSGTVTKRNNRNTVGARLGNNTKKNANAKGYYKILGFNPPYDEITAKMIRNAWRKLALQTHSNKGGDVEKFKIAKEAYEYLSDPDNRSIYNGKKNQLTLTREKQQFLTNNNTNAKQWTKYAYGNNVWYVNKKNPISVWEKNLPADAVVNVNPPNFWTIAESDDKSWSKLKDEYDHTVFYNKEEDIYSFTEPEGVVFKDLPVRKLVNNKTVKLPDPPK